MRALRKLILPLLCILLCWCMGLALFVRAIPQQNIGSAISTDAIVVLTGGALRVEYGFQLLADGKAKTLFITGVGEGVHLEDLAGLINHEEFLAANVPSDAVIALDYEAGDTRGNAEQTARFMREEGYRSLRLVTANYHLPRSLYEFRMEMPDVIMIADPVFPDGFKREAWWQYPGTLRLIIQEYHKLVASWLHHLLMKQADA